jgi:septal ring factor EnvC (AmiA/AmiB activator)
MALLTRWSFSAPIPTRATRTDLSAAPSKLEGRCRRSKRDLTLMYVLCLFFSRHRSREVHQIMIRTGSDRKLIEPDEAEQQAKDMMRRLGNAERQIKKLQEKVADQKQQIREFQAQARHEDGLAAEREELKAEIADLKGEIKELTRANREHVEKVDALRAENARLKAGTKVTSPTKMAAQADLRVSTQPLLS